MTDFYKYSLDINNHTPVVLYRIDYTTVAKLAGITANTISRITNTRNTDGSLLTFYESSSAKDYDFVAVNGVSFFSDLSGEPDKPQITIDFERLQQTAAYVTANTLWTSTLNQKGFVPLVGATVNRIKTFHDFENSSGADILTSTYSRIERYFVEKVVKRTKKELILELSPSLGLLDKNVVDRKVSSGLCSLRYRVPDTANDNTFFNTELKDGGCPYRDTSNYFTRTDDTTTDHTLDYCNKTITSCNLRFGNGNALPWTGSLRANIQQSESKE